MTMTRLEGVGRRSDLVRLEGEVSVLEMSETGSASDVLFFRKGRKKVRRWWLYEAAGPVRFDVSGSWGLASGRCAIINYKYAKPMQKCKWSAVHSLGNSNVNCQRQGRN